MFVDDLEFLLGPEQDSTIWCTIALLNTAREPWALMFLHTEILFVSPYPLFLFPLLRSSQVGYLIPPLRSLGKSPTKSAPRTETFAASGCGCVGEKGAKAAPRAGVVVVVVVKTGHGGLEISGVTEKRWLLFWGRGGEGCHNQTFARVTSDCCNVARDT